mmetsp:Transcript_36819/g.103883  ORF Transcript_36819/g.103883 Transcript_36819/m.103883 type:complete len:92 (+) Transcript_36819:918-1193(+)
MRMTAELWSHCTLMSPAKGPSPTLGAPVFCFASAHVQDQLNWLATTAKKLAEEHQELPGLVFMHIPLQDYLLPRQRPSMLWVYRPSGAALG